MSGHINRRVLLGGAAGIVAAGLPGGAVAGERQRTGGKREPAYRLGLVTYNIAADWDLPTLIRRCKAAGFAGVEFRTTHKHGVEPTLSKAQRADVKKQCADGGVTIVSLGSVCEFHDASADKVARNVEDCRRFVELARDLGAMGVKVRPNGLPKNVAEEKTLDQIGNSLRTCGEAAADAGVEIWCEVHGSGTSEPARMRKIMDVADHKSVGVTWNSNGSDIKDGSVKDSFALLRDKIYCVHINELTNEITGGYPYRELFTLLSASGYDRWTLMEAQGLKTTDEGDLVRFMKYYRGLWAELSRRG